MSRLVGLSVKKMSNIELESKDISQVELTLSFIFRYILLCLYADLSLKDCQQLSFLIISYKETVQEYCITNAMHWTSWMICDAVACTPSILTFYFDLILK